MTSKGKYGEGSVMVPKKASFGLDYRLRPLMLSGMVIIIIIINTNYQYDHHYYYIFITTVIVIIIIINFLCTQGEGKCSFNYQLNSKYHLPTHRPHKSFVTL